MSNIKKDNQSSEKVSSSEIDIDTYNQLTGKTPDIIQVQESFAFPTKEQYSDGFVTRYFVKRTNHSPAEVTEVNVDTFNRLSTNKHFVAVSLPWKITGPKDDHIDQTSFIKKVHGVRNANIATIQHFLDRIPELRYKLSDPLQFWRGGLI